MTMATISPVKESASVSDNKALACCSNELLKARAKHKNLNSSHEAYAVILEEVEEFWLEVMKKSKLRDKKNMAKELVQIAAMAIRSITDLGLTEHLGEK